MTKKEKLVKEKEMDIEFMEQSVLFHTNRIKNFGKPNSKGAFHVKPFDDVDPKILLPYLKKALKTMKNDLKNVQ